MIREVIGKIKSMVSVRPAHFHLELLAVLVNNLLRVDPPGLVDLFEQEESCVFRFPAQQQNSSTLEFYRTKSNYKWPEASVCHGAKLLMWKFNSKEWNGVRQCRGCHGLPRSSSDSYARQLCH